MPFATEYVGIDKKLAAQLLMLIATCKQTFSNISAIACEFDKFIYFQVEIFIRPGAGYLWTLDFARNKIGLLAILGSFCIILGITDILAPVVISDIATFITFAGLTIFWKFYF